MIDETNDQLTEKALQEAYAILKKYELKPKKVILITPKEIDKNYLHKQKVKEVLIKNILGNNHIHHELCDRPYGDDCGYCVFCKQRQQELITKISEDLGVEWL